jgi:hypothetical protein
MMVFQCFNESFKPFVRVHCQFNLKNEDTFRQFVFAFKAFHKKFLEEKMHVIFRHDLFGTRVLLHISLSTKA